MVASNMDELRKQHPGMLLLFRVDDRYEFLHDMDIDTARVLAKVPASFPKEQLERQLRELLKNGLRVALCEPIESEQEKRRKRIDTFLTFLREELVKNMRNNPQMYRLTPGDEESIHRLAAQSVDFMRSAFLKNERSFSLIGPSIKGTCKRLEIKCTYKAIEAFLNDSTN